MAVTSQEILFRLSSSLPKSCPFRGRSGLCSSGTMDLEFFYGSVAIREGNKGLGIFWRREEIGAEEMRGGGRSRRWWLSQVAMVALWVSASVWVWVVVHWYMRKVGMSRAAETLVVMCEERAGMLQDQFAVSVNHVHSLAALVSAFQFLKEPSHNHQEMFAYYTAKTSYYTARTAFERSMLDGVAYAERVVHSDREKFESQQGWTIKTFEWEQSPEQEEYAPVVYTQEAISHVASIDMMSSKEDHENILRARATGKAVLTTPFWLLKSNHRGVVLTFPVYRSDLSPNATIEERIHATAGLLSLSLIKFLRFS